MKFWSLDYMHILMLTQTFLPEPGSAPVKMSELAHFLKERGHQISVVSQVPSYPAGLVYPGYEGVWFRREYQNGVRIIRTWSYPAPRRDRFKPLFLNYTTFMTSALAGILSGMRPDVIFVYSPPLFLGITASIASKIWRCPFVFWVCDLYPRAALSLGFLQDNLWYRLACAMEKFIYRQASRIFVYSHQMAEEVVADGGEREKIECHPLWIDTELFRPDTIGAAQVRVRYGWGEKFVILYGGNIGMVQGLEVLLETACLLRQVKDIHFVLVGSGAKKEELMNQVKELNLTNVQFISHQPLHKIPAFLSAADLLFAHLKSAPHRVGTIPEKVLAYMACGRPVLMAVQEGAASELINSHQCGVTVPPEDPESLSNAILSLYRKRQQLDDMGKKGRQAAVSFFAAPKVLAAMAESLENIGRSA